MPGRAYGRPSESRRHVQAMTAELARRRAVNSGAIPGGTVLQHRHQWTPVGGDCMGCTSRRCDAVRAFTTAEFQDRYGFIPTRSEKRRTGFGDFCRAMFGLLVLVATVAGIGASLYYGHAYCVAHGTCGQ